MHRHLALVLTMGLAVAGCDLEVPDLNNPGLDQLEENPTPSAVSAAATGLLIDARAGISSGNGYVSQLGILGRESYNFDNADPRNIQELLAGDLNSGSPFGGAFWTAPYATVRDSNIVLNATDVVEGFSDAEKESIRGFAKTIQALALLQVIDTHDVNGAVVDTNIPPDELAPIVGKDETFTFIAGLLDDAATNLAAGGDAFPFALSTGFDGLDTPPTFLQFNRALRARVAVYMKDYQAALDALDDSFISADPMAPNLDFGAYHSYSTAAGDATNGLINPNIYAHPSVLADAEVEGDTVDARATSKLAALEEPATRLDLMATEKFTIYGGPAAPTPIIRNEELILIRAEANIGLNNIEEAAADLNFIRVHSGGLSERADLSANNIEDELLYNRRYSLLFEGGHRWIDMRRFGRLDELPLDKPGFKVNSAYPIPLDETNARK